MLFDFGEKREGAVWHREVSLQSLTRARLARCPAVLRRFGVIGYACRDLARLPRRRDGGLFPVALTWYPPSPSGHTTTLAAPSAKGRGRLIRCTVPGSTPNRSGKVTDVTANQRNACGEEWGRAGPAAPRQGLVPSRPAPAAHGQSVAEGGVAARAGASGR